MSLVTKEQVRALVKQARRLPDPDLQDVIDREEAYLARRIGPLAGSRTLRFRRPTYSVETWALRLPRPTLIDDVAVVDNGVVIAAAGVRLLGRGYIVERAGNLIPGSFSGPVDVTFTPSDELEVVRVVIELVRLQTTETGFSSETIGGYTYQRGLDTVRATRFALVQSLKPKPEPHSIPLQPAFRRLTFDDVVVNHNIP